MRWRHRCAHLLCCRTWLRSMSYGRYYSTPSRQSSINFCLESVRKNDYDHFLCCLLLPKSVQPAVFAVRAFNIELAQVHDLVTEEGIGRMRMQFWRDALDNIYKGDPPVQPVAMALADAVKEHKLTKKWLTRLLEARETELSSRMYRTTQDVETYAENTFSSLLYLTLETLGVRDVNADHAASHVGKAEGIITLLRAAGYYRAQRHVPIPMDIIMRHGATQEDFIRGRLTQPVKDTVYDFASLAHTHINKARSLKKSIPRDAWIALLPTVVCEKFLQRIQGVDFDPFSPHLTTRPPLLPVELLLSRLRRTF